MSSLEEKRQAVMDAQKNAGEAKEEANRLLKELQAICNHEFVFGLEYKPENEVALPSPARRICECCTLEEEAKYLTTFSILTNEPIKIFKSTPALNPEFLEFVSYRGDLKPLKAKTPRVPKMLEIPDDFG